MFINLFFSHRTIRRHRRGPRVRRATQAGGRETEGDRRTPVRGHRDARADRGVVPRRRSDRARRQSRCVVPSGHGRVHAHHMQRHGNRRGRLHGACS